MTLFKYKAPTPFEHIADILINERLFCCPYYRMNDPFEGVFLESIEMDGARFSVLTTPDELMAPEDALEARVCSLSSDRSSVLLWSFYAQRLEGVCFEIDCSGLKPCPQEVKYPTEIPKFAEAGFAPTVLYALSHKRNEWRFEQEYRLISTDEYVSIKGRLRQVVLGPRCNETIATAIRKLAPQGCEVHKAKLDMQRRAIVDKRNRWGTTA
jgi:hypothetical protein